VKRAALLCVALAGCGDDVAPALGAAPLTDAGPDATPADAAALPPVEIDFGAASAPEAAVLAALEPFEGTVSVWTRDQSSGEASAHDADRPVFSGTLLRLLPVLTYARLVELDPATADLEVSIEARHLRAGGMGDVTVGRSFTLEALARRVLVDANRTAEAALVAALGGSAAIGEVEGLGRYLAPCEVDRAFATDLDARFAELDCTSLSRWVATREDADAGFEVGPITREARGAAWASVVEDGAATGTARAWGRLLARIDAGAWHARRASAHVRDLLDASVGDGGGDRVPAAAWVGAIGGALYRGRHWVGFVRGAERTTVATILTHAHARAGLDTAGLFADLVAAAHGGEGDWPPAERERPAWLLDAMLVGDGHADCDESDLEALLECHRAARVSGYGVGDTSAVAVFLRDGPLARTAWFWTEPGGRRHRFQASLGAGGWWVWSRTFPVEAPGDWHASVYINSEPYLSRFFVVR